MQCYGPSKTNWFPVAFWSLVYSFTLAHALTHNQSSCIVLWAVGNMDKKTKNTFYSFKSFYSSNIWDIPLSNITSFFILYALFRNTLDSWTAGKQDVTRRGEHKSIQKKQMLKAYLSFNKQECTIQHFVFWIGTQNYTSSVYVDLLKAEQEVK